MPFEVGSWNSEIHNRNFQLKHSLEWDVLVWTICLVVISIFLRRFCLVSVPNNPFLCFQDKLSENTETSRVIIWHLVQHHKSATLVICHHGENAAKRQGPLICLRKLVLVLIQNVKNRGFFHNVKKKTGSSFPQMFVNVCYRDCRVCGAHPNKFRLEPKRKTTHIVTKFIF